MSNMTPMQRAYRLAIRERADMMRHDLGLPPAKWPDIDGLPSRARAPQDSAPTEREHDFLRSLWRSFRGG